MALRTPASKISCRGPRDPREARSCTFPVGGDDVNPRHLRSSYQLRILRFNQADIRLVFDAVRAQPVENLPARPTRNPPSHRRA